MKTKIMLFYLAIILLIQYTACYTQVKPTLAKVQPVEDEYFGIKITDPYRYMENLQDPDVEKWFKSQTDYARSVLNRIPGRQSLVDKMREFDKRRPSRINNLKITDNDQYFYLKTTPEMKPVNCFIEMGMTERKSFCMIRKLSVLILPNNMQSLLTHLLTMEAK